LTKILTIVGTRPELIRLSEIIRKLDTHCDHILVDTQQNDQHMMSDVFYQELGIREPNYRVSKPPTKKLGHQIGNTFIDIEEILKIENPDKVLILGDTNTSLCALLVERMGYPVYHMEAGNRCYDKRVPEEINRRAIDAVSSYNLPYTEMSKQNLLAAGIPKEKIFVTGNPIFEVLQLHDSKMAESTIFKQLGITWNNYALVTCHRAETVDKPERFEHILMALIDFTEETKLPIVYPMHPRAKQKAKEHHPDLYKELQETVIVTEPLGFIDFGSLEMFARVILTDSGTVQEEACIFNIPSVILRDSMERQEVIETGGSIVAGVNAVNILHCSKLVLNFHHTLHIMANSSWELPTGYGDLLVSDKVVQFLIGNQL